jgi:hypothetical protein
MGRIAARSQQVFIRMCFGRLQRLVALLQRGQGQVDFDGDFCGRVVVVCGNGIFDLAGMVNQGSV